MSDPSLEYELPARRSEWQLYVLTAALIGLIAASAYLYHLIQVVREETSRLRESTVAEISNFREATVVANQLNRRRVDGLRQELEATRRQAAVAVGQAKREAQVHAEQLARQIVYLQRKQDEQVLGELNNVREVATAASLKAGEVSDDVRGVKTEVASTRSDLDRTLSDLKRVTGDLGVMSNLIATNARELAALKALGERDYYEFNLTKARKPQRIGDVGIVLKKADPKRHRFTIELVTNDRKIEKKDRGVNEPVQFYTPGSRRLCELVVNEVSKDQIKGYLSVPKAPALRELTELRR